MSLVRSGRKTCTVRLGVVDVSGTEIYLTDGHERVKVRIAGVDNRRVFRELNNQDAVDEGFSSVEELREDLKTYYGNIDPEQPITVIRFVVAQD